eukprot:2462556-Prymnesium_polylepis.1
MPRRSRRFARPSHASQRGQPSCPRLAARLPSLERGVLPRVPPTTLAPVESIAKDIDGSSDEAHDGSSAG